MNQPKTSPRLFFSRSFSYPKPKPTVSLHNYGHNVKLHLFITIEGLLEGFAWRVQLSVPLVNNNNNVRNNARNKCLFLSEKYIIDLFKEVRGLHTPVCNAHYTPDNTPHMVKTCDLHD